MPHGIEDREWETFHEQIKDVPHSFVLEQQERLTPNLLKRLNRVLESDIQVGFQTTLETARARNLLAYVLFSLGKSHAALDETEAALKEGENHNLVSLANMAVIQWQLGRRLDAQTQVNKLLGMRRHTEDFDYQYLKVKAKAELAFSYTRFGPNFSKIAVKVFTDVIAKARDPEVWLWKFGLGMTKRRFLHAQFAPMCEGEDAGQLGVLETLRLFLEVTQNCPCPDMKAKAYVEVALLMQMKWSSEILTILDQQVKMTPLEACRRALALDENDCSVLWKSGKIYRYEGQLDEACRLLEKAVSLRPTSAELHQLGLVYKAMVTRATYFDRRNCNGSRDGRDVSPHGATQPTKVKTLGDHDTSYSQPVPASHDSSRSSIGCSSNNNPNQQLPQAASHQRPLKGIREAPTKDSSQFSWDNQYVQKSVEYLRKAVGVSEGDNARAMYDLALMHRALGELPQALILLEKILQGSRQVYRGPLVKVTAYELAGLILIEMSENETDYGKKRSLYDRGQSMLNMALLTASRLYPKMPRLPDMIKDVFQSFSTLLKAADTSMRSPHEIVREKARLFHLIKEHKNSIQLLKIVEAMAPEECGNPDHLRLFIQNYVGSEQYEEALTFIEILQQTSESENIIGHFNDKNYIQKVYMLAARQDLLKTPNVSLRHRLYFCSAFTDILSAVAQPGTSSEDSATSGDEYGVGADETWDVMIIHERTAGETADVLTSVLHDICGLNVTSLYKHVLLGRLEEDGVVHNMSRSRLVVVLAGARKISGELRLYIQKAARRHTTVTLLTEGNHLPKMLNTHRSRRCTLQELLDIQAMSTVGSNSREEAGARHGCEDFVLSVCELFSFLINLQMWSVILE